MLSSLVSFVVFARFVVQGKPNLSPLTDFIKDPCSKLKGIFDPQGNMFILIAR
jgi:hypothetical protein